MENVDTRCFRRVRAVVCSRNGSGGVEKEEERTGGRRKGKCIARCCSERHSRLAYLKIMAPAADNSLNRLEALGGLYCRHVLFN